MKTTQLGMDNLVGSIIINSNHNIIRGSYLAVSLMDGEILVGKQWERDLICVFKYFDFIGRIPSAYADHFDLAFEVWIILGSPINFVHSRGILLAVRTVHAKNLYDNHLCLDLGHLEMAMTGNSQVIFFIRALRSGETNLR